jgi:LacI family transcriptional regulator
MPRPPAKISQHRIAQDLGVSQALVSLVLNGRSEGVSAESYRRIWDHAISLGYMPKGMRPESSPVALGQGQFVGFVLRHGLQLHTQSNFFSHVQQGLHSALLKRGIVTSFLGSEDTLDDAALREAFARRKNSLGVAILGEVQLPFLKSVRQLEPRAVVISASYPGLCHSVLSNERQSLDLLVQHLFDLGHRQIGWFGGNQGMGRHESRFDAFKQALQLRGLELGPENCVVLGEGDRKEGREAALNLIANSRRQSFPTAIVCFNGMMARGAVNALLQRQWSVPEDLTVVAVDATRALEEEEPGITGAMADPESLGAAAADLLLRSTGAANETFTDLILPATLTVRSSSGAPRTAAL